MKSQLKYSLLALLILACILLILFFLIDTSAQTWANKPTDENLSEKNTSSSQVISQHLTQERKRIKGLFVDYYADELNLTSVNETTMPHLSPLSENNLSLDINNITLLIKPYVDFISPLQSEYFKFLHFKDKNTSTQSSKPKLCIIIDDMASREQVNELKATGLKLTPSFFPADKNHPKTPIFASEFEFFMVHLPLAAVHYNYEERETLKPEDSQELIDAKIAKIAKDFHGLKFINNHTGSLFTDDTKAMRKLFHALKQHDLIFVDSMTIGSSKGALISKEFGQNPIKRNIFLDNENDINAIKTRIKQAVQIAHKKGFAIAIAHPRKNTFKALEQSKELLQSVELVYLSEVYENP